MNKSIVDKRSIYMFLTMLVVVVMYTLFVTSPTYAIGQSPDNTWMTNGTVFDTQLSEDGKTLYVAGRFTVVKDRAGNKIARTNLAAINVATGEPVRTWRPAATGGDKPLVRELAVKNGTVYIGGTFTAVNGAPRQNLAAVDAATGALVTGFAPSVTTTEPGIPLVSALAIDGSRLYVGGRFNTVNGSRRGKLVALNPTTGALDNGWRPKSASIVWDLEFSSDGASIFAVGRFRSITGSDGVTAPRVAIARLYTDTGNVHPWTPSGGTLTDPQTGHDITVTLTRIYVGLGDQSPNFVAAFRLDNGNVGSQVWRFFTVGDVQTVELSPDGSRLFFGGHFGMYNLQQEVCGKYLRGLASLNPANGQIYCDWIPQISQNRNGPWDMTMIGDNQLWLGGDFGQVSGVNQTNLARFDLSG